eukprot:20601-Pleurochrysis_carterae.AAC.2
MHQGVRAATCAPCEAPRTCWPWPEPKTQIGGALSRERRTHRFRGDWRRGRKQWRAVDALSRGPLAVPEVRVKRKDRRWPVECAPSSSLAHYRAGRA